MRELDYYDGKRGIPLAQKFVVARQTADSSLRVGNEPSRRSSDTHFDHKIKTYVAIHYSNTIRGSNVSQWSQPTITIQTDLSRGETCHRPPSVANAEFSDATSIKIVMD